MSDWTKELKADPTAWLLASDAPSIRYWTLVDVLQRPADDRDVTSARSAIADHPSVVELLAAQKGDGYWSQRDYYLPRASRGTFWVLSMLGDLGLTAEDDRVRRGCEFMFAHQRDTGVFCRRRRVTGQGMVWQEDAAPCTHARIVRFLIQFGYGDDPRVRKAIDWLLETQRDDGMWLCRAPDPRGCLRATLDVLRIAVLDSSTADRPAIEAAGEAVCRLIMEPRTSRYHVGPTWGTWERLEYPHFGFNVVSVLEALARLGHTLCEPRIRAGVDYLLSRQLPNGTWPLDESYPRSPLDVGRPGSANPFVTLGALRALKRLYGQG